MSKALNARTPMRGEEEVSRTARRNRSIGSRLRPVGVIRSTIKVRTGAPMQGSEGAPDAWLEVRRWAMKGLHRLNVGDELIIVTWLHRARRNVLQVHPRSDPRRRL